MKDNHASNQKLFNKWKNIPIGCLIFFKNKIKNLQKWGLDSRLINLRAFSNSRKKFKKPN